jgi:hypothetical protein
MAPRKNVRRQVNDVDQHVVELLQLLGMCAKLAPTFDTSEPGEGAKRVLGAMRSAIEDLWAWLATNAAAEFQGASVDSANPGYLIRDKVLVPFYLLQDLPGAAELAEIAALGLSLRVTDDGVICLSGSTALLGSLKFVGDIDYCEYAVPGTYTTADIVASASAHAVRTALPLCERVKVVDPKWSQNCAAWDASTPRELTRCIDEDGAYQLKLDFITSTQAVGPVEATNMALLLAEGREDEILRASFAAQEIPILGSVLPRPLCEPLQLGRYINFLIEQVQQYADANPVKALKRALSLARILMLPEWSDDLIEYLRDPRAALSAAMEARSQLLESLSGGPEVSSARAQTREALRRSLESTIAELEKALEASPGAHSATHAAADLWAGETALVLSSFIQDIREAIAAA